MAKSVTSHYTHLPYLPGGSSVALFFKPTRVYIYRLQTHTYELTLRTACCVTRCGYDMITVDKPIRMCVRLSHFQPTGSPVVAVPPARCAALLTPHLHPTTAPPPRLPEPAPIMPPVSPTGREHVPSPPGSVQRSVEHGVVGGHRHQEHFAGNSRQHRRWCCLPSGSLFGGLRVSPQIGL